MKTRLAPAKINLCLHITGKRADGYHTLESLVAFADIGDTLSLEEAPADRFSLSGPFAAMLAHEALEDNLVVRAIGALRAESSRPLPPVALGLHKELPVGAGIGGGSADAAAALHLLNEHWQLHLPLEALSRIGLALGADVPVCLRAPAACWMTGIGETLCLVPELPALHAVLVNPGMALSTREVFAAYAHNETRSFTQTYPTGESWEDWLAWLKSARNDLAEAATALMPSVGDLLRALADQAGCILARLSGSGPTCFGLFDDASGAMAAAKAIGAAHPEWWVWAVTLSRP